VGVGRGVDGQNCHVATSLTAQSAGSPLRVPVFRRPGVAGGPPGHPAHHPGGWLRADKVPVRRHGVRHLLNRSGCCRGGRQSRPGPGGGCQRLERGRRRRLTGQVTWLRRTVPPGSPIWGTAHGRTGRQRRSCPAAARRARRWPGRRGKTGISPSQACSRALALHAPGQPGRSRFTGPACEHRASPTPPEADDRARRRGTQ
jgi:hypothetical protein